MIFKKITLPAASTIKLIILILLISKSFADENTNKKFSGDSGTLSIMYHRFNETKYPSTNTNMEIFKKQIELINKKNIDFYNPEDFVKNFDKVKTEKKILITIDDAFTSFYNNAWPFLKSKKIPFILFVSTQPIGKNGYMNWDQIKEIENESFAFIGNHSHSHEYLVNYEFEAFKKDINKSIKIFEENLGYNPPFFSYPFGEYSLQQKNFIKKNFRVAFGQHSGVIDLNKDKYELPRFPINEKYGNLERFSFLIGLLPLEYKSVSLNEKLISSKDNPPKLKLFFFEDQKNLNKISCFSNEGDKWQKTQISIEKSVLSIKFIDKFKERRGRLNCSLNENGVWRWLGLQFTIKEN